MQQPRGLDTLTGLETYGPFHAALEGLVQKGGGEAADYEFSVALADIDSFAKLNAEYGRDVCDALLEGLAEHLSKAAECRGTVYRYGGDAFAVLLPHTEKEEAFLLMEAMRRTYSGKVHVDAGAGRKAVSVAISAGLSAFPEDGGRAQELIRKMNEALYRAKIGGGGRVCLAREEKMVTKTSHYAQGQLHGLSRLAKREGVGEAVLLREALDDLLRKYNR